MKANRKFTRRDDAVSPVIAVILMVAITVVLAATVYVWVSGFGASGTTPAKTMAITGAGVISTAYTIPGVANASDQLKNYTVSSASPGMKYSDVKLTLDGTAVRCKNDWEGTYDGWRVRQGGSYIASWVTCDDTNGVGPDAVIQAGDLIQIYDDGGSLSGKTLRFIDSNANSVILTLVVG